MLAIAGGKGGCGKTTTALCLAAAYARRRRRPLVVDADRGMPNCHLYADTPADRGVEAVAVGADPVRTAERASRLPGVDVLAGGDVDPDAYLDRLPAGRPVLVDAAAGAGADVGAVLSVADATLVVTTPRREAVVDALKTAALARALGTPVAAAAVVGTDRDVSEFARAIDAPATAVPFADDPIGAVDVAAAYDRLAARTGPNP